MKTIIVSAADTSFFYLLKGLIESLFATHRNDCPQIGVLDLGLNSEQLAWLKQKKVTTVIPEWDFEFAGRDTRNRCFMAQTARPFLGKYFPEYEILIWMDADTWIQERDAVGWLQHIAAKNHLAICQEMHNSYKRHYKNSEIFGKYAIFKDFFGPNAAEIFGFTPSINVGVFALAKDAPHWQIWRRIMSQTLQVESSFFAEQTSLDYAIYKYNLPVTWLPAQCNWLCHQALPKFCPRQKRLVEPGPHHARLWIIHLTMATKDCELEIETTLGNKIANKLNYHNLQPMISGTKTNYNRKPSNN